VDPRGFRGKGAGVSVLRAQSRHGTDTLDAVAVTSITVGAGTCWHGGVYCEQRQFCTAVPCVRADGRQKPQGRGEVDELRADGMPRWDPGERECGRHGDRQLANAP
jgi:hypothetical protein